MKRSADFIQMTTFLGRVCAHFRITEKNQHLTYSSDQCQKRCHSVQSADSEEELSRRHTTWKEKKSRYQRHGVGRWPDLSSDERQLTGSSNRPHNWGHWRIAHRAAGGLHWQRNKRSQIKVKQSWYAISVGVRKPAPEKITPNLRKYLQPEISKVTVTRMNPQWMKPTQCCPMKSWSSYSKPPAGIAESLPSQRLWLLTTFSHDNSVR